MSLGDNRNRLLDLIQTDFPLTVEPYTNLGQRLDIDGDEVMARIREFKNNGLVRQISPVFDARRLGYKSTLVAARIAANESVKAEELIGGHPGVSHFYERNHHFNLWFTLAVPPEIDIDSELASLLSPLKTSDFFSLPAVKLFKIGAYFSSDNRRVRSAGLAREDGSLPQRLDLSTTDRLIVRELQQDLPLVSTPFDGMASRLKMDTLEFLARCQALLDTGAMRRFGASINHRKAGFQSNAMTCWTVPANMVDAAGRSVALYSEVSHCYERKTNSLWQYNLFAMIHGHTEAACRRIADAASTQIGINNYVVLLSTREFKKTRIRYLV